MFWLSLAFGSAFLLGLYDVVKKKSLDGNSVIPILFLTTFFSCMIFIPLVGISVWTSCLDGGIFYVPRVSFYVHGYILLKSIIVLLSWLMGYFGIKYLPLTIVGPINATRPILVLLGAIFVFGERLNILQWIGVVLAVISFLLLSRSGKKEGIIFLHNKYIGFIVLAAIFGAISGLYDKYLMAPMNKGGMGVDRMVVQSWYNLYQTIIMGVTLFLLWLKKSESIWPFRWKWSILLVSIFLSAADFMYFYALEQPDAMISVVSMVRRGCVIVSFMFGALLFKEKNLKSKLLDLLLVLLGMVFLYLGTR